MQQATVNLFADMGAQPGSLQSGIVRATASSDSAPPVSSINPIAGRVAVGTNVTIAGTASDVGGRVGAVEVSVDDGVTWRRAEGLGNWTFTWTPQTVGSAVVRSRAVDDSLNLERQGPAVAVTVKSFTGAASLWSDVVTPSVLSVNEFDPVELGVKFEADIDGFITALRFYKGPANTGAHLGNLWTADGVNLASALYANETVSGWQQVNLPTPIPIEADTTYIASYHTNGGWSYDSQYFLSDYSPAPLTAPASGAVGGNGVFAYGPAGSFPNGTFNASNYWVDVVFTAGTGGPNTPPSITSAAAFTIAENQTAVGTVTATDPDAGDTLSYAIAGGADAARFTINATTGALAFAAAPDFEAPADAGGDNVYDVTVAVSDGALSDSQAIAVTVSDVNEAPANQPPAITSNGGGATAALDVAENSTAVTTVTATDPDAGDTLSYAIAGGADAARFTINATTGALAFAAAPDFEAPADAGGDNVYDVTVAVSDGALSDSQAIAVTVSDVNEAPSAGSSLFTGETPAAAGTDATNYEFGTKFSASQSGTVTALQYYRVAGDAGDTDIRTLSLWNAATGDRLGDVSVTSTGSSTGWQVGTLAAPIAIQAGVSYVVSYGYVQNGVQDAYAFSGGFFSGASNSSPDGVLTAPASGGTSGGFGNGLFSTTVGILPQQTFQSANYWVDVVFTAGTGGPNTPPSITSAAAFTIAENQTAVGTVTATDPDAGDTLSYAIAGGADAARFTINATTGALAFAAAPDFEAPADAGGDNVYDVTVAVSDGALSDSQAIAVTVSDVNEAPANQPPAITSNGGGATAALDVAENSTAVTTVTATDPDAGDTLSYAIAGGADAARFTINATTGALAFAAAPDFEAPADAGGDNVYDVTVAVSDGALSDSQAIAVTVSDVNEAPSAGSSLFTGETPAAAGTDATNYEFGTKFSASQSGTVTALQYYRVAGDAGDTDIRTLSLWNAATGDRLGDVSVTSTGSSTGWQVGTLAAPIAIQAGVSYVVSYGYVQNGVQDAYAFSGGFFSGASNSSPDGVLTAPASGGTSGGFGNGLFSTTVGILPQQTFQSANYWVDVVFTAGTGGPNTPPSITSAAAFTIAENQTAVGTVTATDPDAGDTLSYAIAGGADAARFTINATTGALAFAAAPDFEAPADAGGDNVYDVTVAVSDGALSDSQAIAVTVSDVNEAPANQPPAITSNGGGATAALDVAENSTAVTTVTATDPDAGDTLSYAIAGGADAARFTINATTGALAFAAAPDFEAPADAGGDNVYDVTVAVSDGALSDSQAIAVTVSDVNEAPANQPPAITSNGGGATAALDVAENSTAVTTVTATDPDAGDTLSYAIAGGADAARFTINATTGALAFAAAPDFEAPADAGGDNVYDVTVAVSDGALSDSQAIAVTVSDVNEAPANQPPAITSNGGGATAALDVAENSTAVTTVTATDPDAGDTLSYAIAGGADAARFTINATTGALAFAAAPDFEAPADAGGDNQYNVIVSASDGTNPAVQQAITITVSDVNEFGVTTPADVDPAANNVAENAAAGTIVGVTARASDADGTTNGVSYSLANDAGGRFNIDIGTGVVRVVGGLDFETATSYEVTVRATSEDGSTADAAFTIAVTDVDEAGQTITGTSGSNTLNGGDGPDTIRGLAGNDVLRGNGGNDTLDGGTGTDSIDGGSGDDLVLIRGSEAQADTISGGAGIDTLRIEGTADVVLNGTGLISGIELLEGGGRSLRGTSASNVFDLSAFTISNLTDVLGLGGNDTLIGSGGADALDGGAGVDSVSGGGGDDTIRFLGNQSQTDTIDGGAGLDRIVVDASGGDVFIARTDRISAVERFEGAGVAIRGTNGSDLLDFSGIGDVVNVSAILGLGGADTLAGGNGDDVLTGGGGNDAFVFRADAASGNDRITDFDVSGNDTIRLVGFMPTVNLAAATSFDGLGGLIDLSAIGGDGSVRLSGVTDSILHDRRFHVRLRRCSAVRRREIELG